MITIYFFHFCGLTVCFVSRGYQQGHSQNYLQLAAGLGYAEGPRNPLTYLGFGCLLSAGGSVHFPVSPLSIGCPLSSLYGLLLQGGSLDSLVMWQLGSRREKANAARTLEVSVCCLLWIIADKKASPGSRPWSVSNMRVDEMTAWSDFPSKVCTQLS